VGLVTAAFAFIPSPFGKLGSGAAEKPGQLPASGFPPPWSVEELDACFVVIDSARQKLAYVYFEDEPGDFNTTARSLRRFATIARVLIPQSKAAVGSLHGTRRAGQSGKRISSDCRGQCRGGKRRRNWNWGRLGNRISAQYRIGGISAGHWIASVLRTQS
jgi:hypothetical protein